MKFCSLAVQSLIMIGSLGFGSTEIVTRKLSKGSKPDPIVCPEPQQCPRCPEPQCGQPPLHSRLELVGSSVGTTPVDQWYPIKTFMHGGYRVLSVCANSPTGFCLSTEDSNDNQMWHYTGDETLKNKSNGGKYLTVDYSKRLSLLDREHNNTGQSWTLADDGRIESQRFSGYCLNSWADDNKDGQPIGMYRCTTDNGGARNDRWRRKNGDMITKPKAIDISYGNFITDDFQDNPGSIQATVIQAAGPPAGDTPAMYTYAVTRKEISTTSTDFHTHMDFSDSLTATLSAQTTKAIQVSASLSETVTFNAGFAFGILQTDTTETDVMIQVQIPIAARLNCEISTYGRMITGQIPYTLDYDDGSTWNGLLDHQQAYELTVPPPNCTTY